MLHLDNSLQFQQGKYDRNKHIRLFFISFYSRYITHHCPQGFAGNFKHGWGGRGVTLFEISVRTHDANTYYDLSVIDVFNVPMKVYAPDG
jgi:hypothetical protein